MKREAKVHCLVAGQSLSVLLMIVLAGTLCTVGSSLSDSPPLRDSVLL